MHSFVKIVFPLLFFFLFFLIMPEGLLAAQINSVTVSSVDTTHCPNYYFDIKVSATGNFCREFGPWGDCYFPQSSVYVGAYYNYYGLKAWTGNYALQHDWKKPDPPCDLPSDSCQRKNEFSFFVRFSPIPVAGITYEVDAYVYNWGGTIISPVVTTMLQVPGCECEISINASPSEVWPKGAGNDDKTTATIMVTSTNPPPEGCTVNLKVEPVKDSGGHVESEHTGDRNNHKGSIKDITLTIPGGSSQASTTYQSNEVSGEEKIIAEIKGEKKGETTVSVKVPGLSPLVSKPNLLPWGGTDKHKLGDNNYGTGYTLSAVYYAVGKYAKDNALNTAPDVYLAVIDMSLPWGGLFDINGDWDTPHDWHRVGRSVDFSKYYRDSRGNKIEVIFYDEDGNVIETTDIIDDKKLDGYFANKKYKCRREEKKIGKIHYECPK